MSDRNFAEYRDSVLEKLGAEGTNVRNTREYRAAVLTALGAEFEDEDTVNFERWRVKVLDNLGSGGGGGGKLKTGILRPDAELIQRWSGDDLVIADLGATMPAYNTSETGYFADTFFPDLSPAIDLEDTYDYYVALRWLAIPIYSNETKSKGRNEYNLGVKNYEHVNIRPESVFSLDGSTSNAYKNMAFADSTLAVMAYWTNSENLVLMQSTGTTPYGVYVTVTPPTFSAGKITFLHPKYKIKGRDGILNSSNWSLLTDVRYQWVMEVYRVPFENLEVKGWELQSQAYQICDDIINNGGTLT